MTSLTSQTTGKLSRKEAKTAALLKHAPWITIALTSIPVPLVWLFFLVMATSTESAAVYLLLAGLSLTIGFALGLVIAAILLIYRRNWLSKLRDRLASDGITANEVVWFRSELTSAERKSLGEMEKNNPLLADAFEETLASRLTATRIMSRSRKEMLKIERHINRARTVKTPESASLQKDLEEDHKRLKAVYTQASEHLNQAKTRLQVIETTANRKLSQGETEQMMRRLGSAQDQLPLVLEIAQLEQQILREGAPQADKALGSS
ncbi:MAG TPA: hypothetical protein VFH01_03885 [Pyrinomonadaceae bacterium]|nr:hypothetical protein [Pyrinomonadaceae bacterium]